MFYFWNCLLTIFRGTQEFLTKNELFSRVLQIDGRCLRKESFFLESLAIGFVLEFWFFWASDVENWKEPELAHSTSWALGSDYPTTKTESLNDTLSGPRRLVKTLDKHEGNAFRRWQLWQQFWPAVWHRSGPTESGNVQHRDVASSATKPTPNRLRGEKRRCPDLQQRSQTTNRNQNPNGWAHLHQTGHSFHPLQRVIVTLSIKPNPPKRTWRRCRVTSWTESTM